MPEAILRKHWGITDAIRRETSGGSRATWQLATGDWLARCASKDRDAFIAEAALLGQLRGRIATPGVIPALSAANVVEDGGYLWRITKNVPGNKRPATDLKTYPVLSDALAMLHAALRMIPVALAPVKTGVVKSVAANRENDDAPVVMQALAWLQPRLHLLAALPIGMTHGDFNPTNVLYRDDDSGELAVAGVIDFELSRPDPAVLDYSQLLTMLVCHSDAADLAGETERLFARLKGQHTRDELCIAMVAYWVDLYFRWKGQSQVAEEKFRMRLGQVLKFVEPPSS